MILQALPDTWQVVDDLDALLGEMRRRSHAREQQNVRRPDRAAAENDLAPRTQDFRETVLPEGDPHRALAVKISRVPSGPA